ncbi:killer toxin alpha/beta [Rhypophila decipiens]
MASIRFNIRTSLTSVLYLASFLGAGAADPITTDTPFHSDLYPCPGSCDEFMGPDQWSVYSSAERLAVCNEPVLLTFGTFTTPIGPVRACTAGNDLSAINALSGATVNLLGLPSSDEVTEPARRLHRRQASSLSTAAGCAAASISTKATAQIAQWDSSSSPSPSNSSHTITALQQAQEYLADEGNCNQTLVYGYYKTALVGVYVGNKMQNKAAVNGLVMEELLDTLAKSDSSPGRHVAQVCGQGRNADHVFGIVVGDARDIDWVREAVQSWTKAKCVTVDQASSSRNVQNVALARMPESFVTTATLSARSTGTDLDGHHLDRRALCNRIQVVSGDGCDTLATRCGIHGDDFMTYNPQTGLCANLQEGQWVCCSSGTLLPPPTQGSDGKCTWYAIQSGDWCAKIAASFGITMTDLYRFNNQTWGWGGCDAIHPGDRICVSSGGPPMPAPISNAVCGPQKPGSSPPGAGKTLVDLNPCSLNACCNIWGQCGTTRDFCIVTESETGNPGTAEPGTNGCVQNCGMDIVNNDGLAPQWRKVAYFESWNSNRPCLHMDVRSIDPVQYNTIHFAFLDITADLRIVVPAEAQADFEHFKTMIEFKRIASFGGWAFSTEQATMNRLRDAVNPQNREVFAERCVAFMLQHGLDGLDFDWEYPASPDRDGAEAIEGQHYLAFLTVLRNMMFGQESLSFAAPASYWYLRGFPVAEMAQISDYVIYMTYDLHGQWDYGSLYSQDGCPAGNCLRSHVNMTTTMNTLSMITKAGVPAFQVVVGVTSYGRSFKMEDPSCIYDDHCPFTGPDSGARPGRCTGEAGYLAQAEIDEIVAQNPNTMRWTDATEAQSAYMIYNSTEWVAYMNDHQKAARSEQYRQLGFGGTTDWAVDLQTFTPRNASTRLNLGDYVHCTNVQYEKIEDIPADKSIKDVCYVIYALETTSRFLASGIDRFKSLVNSQGYDRKFNIFAEVQLEQAKGALFAFSSQNGSTYFDCTVAEKVYCCTTCRDGLGHSASECKHCAPLTTTNRDPVCVFDSPWNAENKFEYRNMSQPCPPDYSQRGLGRDQSVWWKLKSSVDWDTLRETIEAETGVNASFIGRGGWRLPSYNNEDTGYQTSCALNPWSSGCVNKHNWFDTLRVLPNYETEDVPNPKTIISDHLDLWQDTIGDINEIVEELRTGRFRMGEETGRIDPRYYPLMVIPMMGMLNSSVTLMEEIMDMADEIAEQKKIEFAMMWVEMIGTVLPFFTPWAALTLSGRLTFARVLKLGITWTGELSSRAAAVYSIIENPELTPAILFGLMAQGALYSVSIGAMLAERASRIDFAALGAFGSIFYVPYQRAILTLEIRTLDHYQAP